MNKLAFHIPIVFISIAVSLQAQIPVPAAGCYLSAFTPGGQQAFETQIQKPIAIEMFYKGWNDTHVPDFPATQCDAIVANGAIPHLTWEPWTGSMSYGLELVLYGYWDTYLAGYAQQVKSWGKPLFIRLGHEMNGNWYPWDGAHNGAGTLDEFGDPAQPDGPERFVAAYRHVHRIFDSIGVTNAAWIWCPNNFPTPNEAWNAYNNFYPGDDVVDWIGFDGYNWGTSQSWSGWVSFFDTFQQVYNAFKNSGKPLMIGEFASAEVGGDKAQWVRDAFFYIRFSFTKLKAITWFDINKETDWRAGSSVASLNAFREKTADAYFLSTVEPTGIERHESESAALSFPAPSPNPANGGIRFEVILDREEECTLKLYNILGEEIAGLAAGRFPAGSNRWAWDGRDTHGRETPSGVYFARLQTSTRTLTQKLIITR